MAKFTSFLLCVVAASLTVVYAVTDDEISDFRQAIAPIIAECSSEYGVSRNEIKDAKQNSDADAVPRCFIACVFKKIEILDANGVYNADKGLSKLRHFVQSDEDFMKFEKIAKQCTKVNDEPVSDGAVGCDRAKLLLSCAFKNRAEMPL